VDCAGTQNATLRKRNFTSPSIMRIGSPLVVKSNSKTKWYVSNLIQSFIGCKMPKDKSLMAKTPEAVAEMLRLSRAESEDWKVQHRLLKRLRQVVKDEAVTHAEVALRGGSSRTRVTAILNGNLDNVSSDLLIRLLGGLGYRVKISVSRLDSAA
jgi:predicted XRE-type DNA-binding protein